MIFMELILDNKEKSRQAAFLSDLTGIYTFIRLSIAMGGYYFDCCCSVFSRMYASDFSSCVIIFKIDKDYFL